jgi:hypothetical protein
MQNSKTYTKIKSETFNIEKAINRLQWRFKNENVKVGESKIIINELDQKAVDFLIEWINNQKLENLNQNLLFAKLYTYSLINEIEFYKDIEFANKKINEVCETDIQQLYNEVYRKLNNLEYLKFCKEKGIITDHIEKMTLNKEQEQKQKDLIKQNESKLKLILKGLWSKEKTYKSLNNTISETINKFK